MDKITLKLVKYFVSIVFFITVVCFAAASIFLSKFYIETQYENLHRSAQEIHQSLATDEAIINTDITAILIKDNSIISLTHGKMGIMPFLRSAEANSFKTKGIFKNAMDSEFLYYKLQTELGDIVVFRNNQYSSDYLTVVYVILFSIFISALLLSIPLISYIGRKLTKPILELEKAASSISKGDFNISFQVETKDEIELLANSLNDMASALKKKYQLQRDFIANVSHDFKTPLSVIRSYSEAIRDGLVDKETVEKYAGESMKEVDRLNNMVMDLLQLSKLQDGAYSLNKQAINLQVLADECISQFKMISEKRNLVILSALEPIEIYADKKYLQRVIYNFIDNAVKFSANNSRIEIYTTLQASDVKLSIKDYGIGIEKHLLEDIWDKYYKNIQSGGMGLGLPICREILKMHNFEYGVFSSPKEGTEFYFIVPKKDLI